MSLVAVLLGLGIVVVVPLAVPLHPDATSQRTKVLLAAALPGAGSLLLDRGWAATVLALPWVGAAVAALVVSATSWWRGQRHVLALAWVAAPAYLLVGALWLLADRLDLEPVGFAPPFVQLTAIHFHYAGCVTAVLAGCAWRWRASPTSATALALVVGGPPVVAAGFTTYAPLQVAGATAMTAGLWALAWTMGRHVAPASGRLARSLLTVSALATLAPMVLAVQWAVGTNYGTPALSVPDMARWHGTTNAVGFALIGVAGWRLSAAATRDSTSAGLPGGEVVSAGRAVPGSDPAPRRPGPDGRGVRGRRPDASRRR